MRLESVPRAGDPAEELAPLDAAAALAGVRALALERFPGERRTLEIFFAELDRRLAGGGSGAPPAAGAAPVPFGAASTGAAPPATTDPAGLPAGSFGELLTRLEELLEALLVGEAHGLGGR